MSEKITFFCSGKQNYSAICKIGNGRLDFSEFLGFMTEALQVTSTTDDF